MAELESHSAIDGELLSAYLDDELSPEERARVQARLASEPAARQMLDRLRSASQALQGLPHEAVGQDLRESILRRAEAAMLTAGRGRSAATVKKSAAADGVVSLPDSLPRITIGQTRRGWVWAALAMAAGLAIMVLQPGGQQNNSTLGDLAASRRSEDLDRVVATDGAHDSELRKLRLGEPAAAPMATDMDSIGSAPPARVAGTPIGTGAAAPAPTSVAVDENPLVASAAPPATGDSSSALRDNGGKVNDRAAAESSSGLSSRFSVPAEQSSRAGGALAGGPALQQSQQLGDRVSDAANINGNESAVALNGPASASGAISGRGMAEVPPRGAVGGVPFDAAATRELAPADALAKAPAQSPAADFVVVRVVATPGALRSKAFENLLTRNGIQLEESAEAESVSQSAGEELPEEVKLNRAMKRTAGETSEESGKLAEDAILVAAPKAMIDSCLSELKRDEANYVGIAIDDPAAKIAADKTKDNTVPLASAPVKAWADDLGTRFNRGQVPPQNVEHDRDEWYGHDYFAGGSREARGGEGRGEAGLGGGGGGFRGGEQKQEQEQLRQRVDTLGMDLKESPGQGRARRIRSWGFDDPLKDDLQPRGGSLAEGRLSTSSSLELGAIPQTVRAPTEAAGENLRVLFLISPDTRPPAAAPPSPAAANRQE